MNKKRLCYLITAVLGLTLSFLIAIIRGLFNSSETSTAMKCLTDGFFVSGVLILGAGLLVFSANEGTFDIISYGVKQVIRVIGFSEKEKTAFADYRREKQEKKKAFGFMVIVGIFLLSISVILLNISG